MTNATKYNQIPSIEGRAGQITINDSDVNYAINKLSVYDDDYSKGIVVVFENYLIHKDYLTMRSELELVQHEGPACHILWDINANGVFLEVLYPTIIEKGGDQCEK